MEGAYKLAFGADFAILLVAVVRVARRLRARPDGTVDQTGNELPALRWIRIVLALFFYGALLDWLVPGTRLEFARLSLPDPARWAGEAAAAAGILLVWWAFETLGDDYRGGLGLWDDHRLVTRGPYRWLRHPVYVGFVVTMLGVGLLAADWVIGGSGLLLTLAIPVLRVPVEEAEMEERFGEEYREYRARTGAFLPRV